MGELGGEEGEDTVSQDVSCEKKLFPIKEKLLGVGM